MSQPLISIIIPCYNVSGYLESCLNSCILQTYKNLEIIVLNDGSIDNTKEIVNYYASFDKRIIPVHKENEGVAKTRKTGIEKATGDYIFFLDGDDYIPLKAVEILINEAIMHNAEIASGNFIEEFTDGFKEIKSLENECLNSSEFIKKMLANRLLSLWSNLFSRKLFDENIIYHTDLKMSEDASLLIQLVHNAKTIKTTDKTVYFYRYRAAAVTKQQSTEKIFDNFKGCFIVEEFALKYGFTIDNDFEVGIPVCNTLNFMLKSRTKNKLNKYWKKILKEKIHTYLIESKNFSSFYYNKNRKNYWRLIFYYRFPYICEWLFQKLYRIYELFFSLKPHNK